VIIVLFIAVIIVTGILILSDANDFRTRFPGSTNLFLLEENNTMLSAISMNNTDSKPIDILDKQKLKSIEDDYNHNRMSSLSQGYYKVFLIKIEAFDDLSFTTITDKNINLDKAQVMLILQSSNARNDLLNIINKDNSAIEQSEADKMLKMDDEQIKGYLFSYALTYFFDPKNTDSFLIELKNQRITVIPETPMFKAIRIVPNFLISNYVKNKATNITQNMPLFSNITSIV